MKKVLVALLVLASISSFAQSDAWRVKHFNVVDKSSLALQGYDPVSYFEGKPSKGIPKVYFRYKGILYNFTNTAHLEAFKQNPAKYEPQYGGWCAYAMGDSGEKVTVDPETYKIVDGKLYLFYNSFFNNTLPKWNKKEAELKKSADANWAKIFN